MAFGKLAREEPVWNVREYFYGLGNMMLAGALALNILLLQDKGVELAWWQLGLGWLGAG